MPSGKLDRRALPAPDATGSPFRPSWPCRKTRSSSSWSRSGKRSWGSGRSGWRTTSSPWEGTRCSRCASLRRSKGRSDETCRSPLCSRLQPSRSWPEGSGRKDGRPRGLRSSSSRVEPGDRLSSACRAWAAMSWASTSWHGTSGRTSRSTGSRREVSMASRSRSRAWRRWPRSTFRTSGRFSPTVRSCSAEPPSEEALRSRWRDSFSGRAAGVPRRPLRRVGARQGFFRFFHHHSPAASPQLPGTDRIPRPEPRDRQDANVHPKQAENAAPEDAQPDLAAGL